MKPDRARLVTQAIVFFQYPQPRVYAMKPKLQDVVTVPDILSVPSTSGLRDETDGRHRLPQQENAFQYPQPRVYAMKLSFTTSLIHPEYSPFSTLNLGSTR